MLQAMSARSEGTFADLRRLADWFANAPLQRSHVALIRVARRLGATAIPLLGRQLATGDRVCREAARAALGALATAARDRVVSELRTVANGDVGDDAKLCALGLLAELGERAPATFSDPVAMRRRSALALAAQLAGPADIASAVDVMLRELADEDIVQILSILGETSPAISRALVGELSGRLDADHHLKQRVRAIAPVSDPLPARGGERTETKRAARPPHPTVLIDAAARVVVVVTRRTDQRWRRWAVLIGANGRLEDCLHEESDDRATGDGAHLIAALCADGYRVASTEFDHARDLVIAAVRRTVRGDGSVPSGYYVGRDLLELGDAHLREQTSQLAHAIELLAAGDHAAASALVDQVGAPDATELARREVIAACRFAAGDTAGAIGELERLADAAPQWPLHHWNLAVATHRAGDLRACYHALRRFCAASAKPTALVADPDQAMRLRCAERMLGELERAARLHGQSLARPRRKRARLGPG